jgi:DNA protecting protein DprA
MGLSMHSAREHSTRGRTKNRRYSPPCETASVSLGELVRGTGRSALRPQQVTLLTGRRDDPDATIFYAGAIGLLKRPAVSIVGTREVTEEGRGRARRLARELARAGVVVVSGLARGVDTAAHLGALEETGNTVAVIGTPLDKAYPIENAELQEEIYQRHLLLTPFPRGERVYPSNFPKRNRVMAAVTDATVIVEASDTSGTLHQAAECGQLGRWLFIMKSVVENPHLAWPAKFIGKDRVAVLSSTTEILDAIRRP